MKTTLSCVECHKVLTQGVHDFSVLVYGHPLCLRHQIFITESGASPQTIDLYLALKSRDLPVTLEFFDGHKHVDIALPGKLYIEVNGSHHYDSVQALTDLSRYIYSLQENISTIAVPDYLLNHPETFRLTVDELAKACRSLLTKSSFWELAHTLTPVQLQ